MEAPLCKLCGERHWRECPSLKISRTPAPKHVPKPGGIASRAQKLIKRGK